MDQTWGTPAPTDSRQDAEQSASFHLPPLVSRFSGRGTCARGIIPDNLMASRPLRNFAPVTYSEFKTSPTTAENTAGIWWSNGKNLTTSSECGKLGNDNPL